jgi:DNA ligase-1
VLLSDVAAASAAVSATSARSTKAALLADVLRRATPVEAEIVATFLGGELRQRRTGVGWAALRDLPQPAERPTLTVAEVDAAFGHLAAVSGPGSAARRRAGVRDLFARATEPEQRLLAGLVAGELRQGAQDGVLLDAVAALAGVPPATAHAALTLAGSVPALAAAVAADGPAGLDRFRLQVGRPLRPMLAQSAPDVPTALGRLGRAGVEWKLDGVRVQVHRDGGDVAAFTRTLDDVTDRLPEVVDAALALPARRLVLDAEAIALRPDGRPAPFQVTASRVGRRADVTRARAETPLSLLAFDLLHLDGADLLARPAGQRVDLLAAHLPPALRVPRIVTADEAAAVAFAGDAVSRGHEGVVLKALDGPYEAGRRGAGWIKVKPRHTLDLVVLAAEWGHGRRRGWLSNLHLGAADPHGAYGRPGGFVMLGKTFKGMTDSMLRWQTERLLQLAVDPAAAGGGPHGVVAVRPELVVEVAFDGVQTSPRYPAGLALRFARLLRHRPDKTSAEADTVDAVRALHVP